VKSKYLYLAASALFLVLAVLQLRPPRNITAAVLNAAAAIIFFFLGATKS
jgi:hypothetical protein